MTAGVHGADAEAPLRVSVAMATYNGERFLEAQLESIARQTRLPAELVVTDDGSSDRTLEILEAFGREAPFPVRAVRNPENLGYADNFLKAASLCTGDLIAFCDQDDVWLERKLEVCAGAFKDREVLLCVHSGELWNGQTRSQQRCPNYSRQEKLGVLGSYPLQGSFGYAMVIRRELLSIADNGHRFRPTETEKPLAHDRWVWLLAAVFGKIVLLPEVLTLYRQHGANQFGGSAVSLGSALASGVRYRDYDAPAAVESRCAVFLGQLAASTAPRWRGRAEAGASFMERCARLNRLRAGIYRSPSSLFARIRAFWSMWRYAGYATGAVRGVALGHTAPRVGYKAALKDGLFGVARLRGR